MSLTKREPSESKRSYFCKICRVACLNRDGFKSHNKGDEHKKCYNKYHGPHPDSLKRDVFNTQKAEFLCILREHMLHLQNSIMEVDPTDPAFRNVMLFVDGAGSVCEKHMVEGGGPRFGTRFYRCLEDYITCPVRTEPLIGLQHIIQLNTDVDHQDAFKCTLCKMIGPLYFIMKHLKTFKHRIKYLSENYSHLFPLYSKHLPYLTKNKIVKDNAWEVEHQESKFDIRVKKSGSSLIGVKNDFWKYIVRKQKQLKENKKHSAYEAQKESILNYMETFVIASAEEETLAQNFAEDLEAAVEVFCQNTKAKHDYASKYEHDQNHDGKERLYTRDSDYKRSPWLEKESIQSQSTSYCKDAMVYHSHKHFAEEDYLPRRKIPKYASTDKLSMFTFTIDNSGSENKPKTSGMPKKQHVSSAPSSATENAVLSTNYVDETIKEIRRTTAGWGGSQGNRLRQNSTDVKKWEALFQQHHPDRKHPKFSWGTKSPSFNQSEINSEVKNKEKLRRASLEALSTFTLFSGDKEPGSATSPFLSLKTPLFKVEPSHSDCEDEEDHHNETSDLKFKQQEPPCSSSLNLDNIYVTITDTSHNIQIPSDLEQQDGNCSSVHIGSENISLDQHFDKAITSHQNSDSEMHCDQFFDTSTDVTHTSESNQNVITHNVQNSDVEACVSKCSDTHDTPSVSGCTSQSSKSQDSGRHLSPEVLELFKGKDTDSIIHILRTLTPFYPALQELNLEIFAKELSGTGAIND